MRPHNVGACCELCTVSFMAANSAMSNWLNVGQRARLRSVPFKDVCLTAYGKGRVCVPPLLCREGGRAEEPTRWIVANRLEPKSQQQSMYLHLVPPGAHDPNGIQWPNMAKFTNSLGPSGLHKKVCHMDALWTAPKGLGKTQTS